MTLQSVTSSRFPYLPITLTVRGRSISLEAILDTGYDGDVMVPREIARDWGESEGQLPWTLIDGSRVRAPVYFGGVAVGSLGPHPAMIAVFGREPLLGQRFITLFRVILDHGLRVIVEP